MINISDRHLDYCRTVSDALKAKGIRVVNDERNETMNYKIREAQLQKIPYMLVVGDKEQESESIGVRHQKNGDLGLVKLTDFVEQISQEATMNF